MTQQESTIPPQQDEPNRPEEAPFSPHWSNQTRKPREPISRRPSHSNFRRDVEGLRAVAICLVLLYHAGLPWIPGGYVGVDVFFVVSGFLITTQLVSELGRTGRISLPRFYARRAKRLLPAAAIVLAVTAMLVRLTVPRARWEEIAGDIVASALYFVNWRLAERSVDYLAEGSAASPVQHYWSLAVEEQFYIVWPLLILLAAVAACRTALSTQSVLWIAIATVALPSFVWAILETSRSPEQAFFVTTTRMWQLGVGAAIALAAGMLVRLPKRGAIVVGWIGLAAIGLSALVFSVDTPWPGFRAALPTFGTAAVIVAGFAPARRGPILLLGTAPFQWVGGLSYSLYLWHWPILTLAAAYAGDLPAHAGVAIAALSVVPAWLTYRLVENPLRYSPSVSRSPRLALSLGGNFTLVGALSGLMLLVSFFVAANHNMERQPTELFGASILGPEPLDSPAGRATDSVAWMMPDPLQATRDLPDLYADGCQQNQTDSEVLVCDYGNVASETTVAVVGDSKIVQWLPALRLIADESDWHIMTYTKSSCSFTAAVQVRSDGNEYTSCTDWNAAVLGQLLQDPPDYILASGMRAIALDEEGNRSVEGMVTGLEEVWSAVTSAGAEVVVIADNPHPGFSVYECVDQNRETLTACTYPRDRASKSAAPTQRMAAQGLANVHVIDMFDAICPVDPCAPVIGNVLVYRQGSHLTATYVKTLAPRLATALSEVGMPAKFEEVGS